MGSKHPFVWSVALAMVSLGSAMQLASAQEEQRPFAQRGRRDPFLVPMKSKVPPTPHL